jgi:hypothetical protein
MEAVARQGTSILISLDLVHLLILISKTVFVSMYTPLVAILFSASV